MSSLSNFAVAILVAHYSNARHLGIFTIVTTTYILMQGLVRSLTSDCLLTRSDPDRQVLARSERAGYAAALALSTCLSAVLVAVAFAIGGEFRSLFLVLAATFPLMAAEDFSRFIGIGRHDPAYAIRLDTAWVAAFFVGYVALRAAGDLSLIWVLGVWAGAGALIGLATVRVHLDLRGGAELVRFWIRDELSVGSRFAGQFMLTTSWAYTVFFVLATVVSVAAIGVIRLAQIAIGPVTVASQGLQSAMVSIAARKFRTDARDAMRFLVAVGLGLAVVIVAWGVAAYLLPTHLATTLAGPTWPQARKLVLYIAVAMGLSALASTSNVGLRALREARLNLRLAVMMIPFLLIPSLGLAKLYGARGFAIGALISSSIYVVLGWSLLLRRVGGAMKAGLPAMAAPDAASESASAWGSA